MLNKIFSIARNGNFYNFLSADLILLQQTRNTFILKRKWPPGLHKVNQKPHKLQARHNVYELVEDTNLKKQKGISVVLTNFVDGIGDKGDIITLKQNIAYNKLLLPGLAVYKTDENVAKYVKQETEIKEKTHSSPYAQRTVNMLNQLTLAVIMNKDQPWVIEPWHIKVSFRKAGYYVPEEAITLPSKPINGPDLNLQNKEFYVTVTINNLETAKVKCRIHHWSTDPSERLPYVFEHWKEPSEPIFNTENENTSVETKLK